MEDEAMIVAIASLALAVAAVFKGAKVEASDCVDAAQEIVQEIKKRYDLKRS